MPLLSYLKRLTWNHSAHIVTIGEKQKEIRHIQRMLVAQLKLEATSNPIADTPGI